MSHRPQSIVAEPSAASHGDGGAAVANRRSTDPGYIFNAEFNSLEVEEILQIPASTPLYADRDDEELSDLSIHGVDSIGSMPVLSFAGEQFLFRKMNYLRYRTALLGEAADAAAHAEELDDLRGDAEAARSHLAECNLRLVASIARRFATAQQDFDELVSEGNVILLKAIDKFDYARGFRFSTYLTYSVQRHLLRVAGVRSRRNAKECLAAADVLDTATLPLPEEDEVLATHLPHMDEMLERMGECLTEREQWVVRERFGLSSGESDSARPFRKIAEEAGLSRERVRQIQLTALAKLRRKFLQRLEGESPVIA